MRLKCKICGENHGDFSRWISSFSTLFKNKITTIRREGFLKGALRQHHRISWRTHPSSYTLTSYPMDGYPKTRFLLLKNKVCNLFKVKFHLRCTSEKLCPPQIATFVVLNWWDICSWHKYNSSVHILVMPDVVTTLCRELVHLDIYVWEYFNIWHFLSLYLSVGHN